MRIIIEIEDGAVRATHVQPAEQRAANAGGPPEELLQLLGSRPAPAPQASGGQAAVNVGGPPEELLRALAAPLPLRRGSQGGEALEG